MVRSKQAPLYEKAWITELLMSQYHLQCLGAEPKNRFLPESASFLFFVIFFHFSCKKCEKAFFNQHSECAACKCWSKYTTDAFRNKKMQRKIWTEKKNWQANKTGLSQRRKMSWLIANLAILGSEGPRFKCRWGRIF